MESNYYIIEELAKNFNIRGNTFFSAKNYLFGRANECVTSAEIKKFSERLFPNSPTLLSLYCELLSKIMIRVRPLKCSFGGI